MVPQIMLDTLKISFNFKTESTNKTHSIINNAIKVFAQNKVLMLGSNELDTINNMNIYDIYKDLCLGEKEHEQKLLKDIH